MPNALDISSGPPPAPLSPQSGAQPDSIAPAMPLMPQGMRLPTGTAGSAPGAPGTPQPPQAPAPNHAQTVAALRHLHAFEAMYEKLLALPELGKSSIRSQMIDGSTKLVADLVINSGQAVQLLGSFPDDPQEQRKWIQAHIVRDRQAMDVILDHHRQAHIGTQDWAIEGQAQGNPDGHMDDISGMMGAHYRGQGRA